MLLKPISTTLQRPGVLPKLIDKHCRYSRTESVSAYPKLGEITSLTVLPIVHEVLKPQIEPYLLAPTYKDDLDAPWRMAALRRLRSLNAQSVTAYQVIELPRSSSDPPEGELKIVLGAASRGSWWERVARYVDRKVEQLENEFGLI